MRLQLARKSIRAGTVEVVVVAFEQSLRLVMRAVRNFVRRELTVVVLYLAVLVRHCAYDAAMDGREGWRRFLAELAQTAAVVRVMRQPMRNRSTCCEGRRDPSRRLPPAGRKPARRQRT
jgi:hypothetical protein